MDVTHVPLVIQALLSRLSLKLCEKCGSNPCVRVFLTPWGHVNFHDHIWALRRHLGHMTYMLDSDWLKKFLLRSDWLTTEVALYTTNDVEMILKNLSIVAYHQPNNLSDTFVRAQLPETNNCNNDRATPGSFRCSSKCTTCPYCWFSVSRHSK